MGVYIKGKSLPGNCEECPCSYLTEGAHHDYCEAVGYNAEINSQSGRPSWCPLIEVSAPHGRLIDADAIPYKKIMYDGDDFYYGVTKPYIDRMPTIIQESEVG